MLVLPTIRIKFIPSQLRYPDHSDFTDFSSKFQ
jgi:hypothetical protein